MRRALATVLLGVGVTACAPQERPPDATLAPEAPQVEVQRGTGVYYASRFHGRRTASGARLNQAEMVAAHPSLPFGCVVRVTNPREGRSVDVKIIDRGPSPSGQRRGIVIDVSQGAARELGFLGRGSAVVELEIPKRCRTGPAA
jgi:rare lipoprotein A